MHLVPASPKITNVLEYGDASCPACRRHPPRNDWEQFFKLMRKKSHAPLFFERPCAKNITTHPKHPTHMKIPGSYLSKREQQIMEALFKHGKLSANDLLDKLPGSPTNSTVRTQLRILEDRGHVGHEEIDGKFVYFPIHAAQEAGQSALQGVIETFYQGSILSAVSALLDMRKLSPEEVAEIERLIAEEERK